MEYICDYSIASKTGVVKSRQDDTNGFVEAIIDFANRNKEYEVLMPIDAETYVISMYKEMIQAKAPHLKIPVHEYKYIDIANNKLKMLELANSLDIPIPKTYMPNSLKEDVLLNNAVPVRQTVALSKAKTFGGLLNELPNIQTDIEIPA